MHDYYENVHTPKTAVDVWCIDARGIWIFLDNGCQTFEPPITDSTDDYVRQYYDKSVY